MFFSSSFFVYKKHDVFSFYFTFFLPPLNCGREVVAKQHSALSASSISIFVISERFYFFAFITLGDQRGAPDFI